MNVDNTLIDLKIKRYLTQYEYLESELEETKYMFEKYNKKFLKEYYNVDATPKPKVVNPEELNENIEINEPMDAETDKQPEVNEEDIQLKKLYRLLSLKTHPDKNNGSKEEFHKIHKAYKEKDILKLFSYSIKHNVKINNELVAKCLSLFEQNINTMQSKIQDLKHTLAWQWCHANDEQKELFKQAKF